MARPTATCGTAWRWPAATKPWCTRETFDVTDPAVRSRLAGQDQHHCRVECEGEVTYGLVEPYDTLCYDVSKAGVLGFSLLEG